MVDPTGGVSTSGNENANDTVIADRKNSTARVGPIKFKDVIGRKFLFPWQLCKTWKGMEELIKQAFLHVDIIGPHVDQGHYDLMDPDGYIILPQAWEVMVQPGWSITMHMWPMLEPSEKPPPPLLTAAYAAEKSSSSKQRMPKAMLPSVMAVMRPPPPPPFATWNSGDSQKPKKKPAPGGFFAWASGGNDRSGDINKSNIKQ